MDVEKTAVSGLDERVKEVCELRGYRSSAEWCRAAGLSAGYLATYMSRRVRLPETGAEQLAAAARVSVAWLRDGKGPREGTEPLPAVQSSPPVGRASLVQQITKNIADLTAVGDFDGARILAQSLTQLLSPPSPSHVLEQDEEGPEDGSHMRRKFVAPPKTGT